MEPTQEQPSKSIAPVKIRFDLKDVFGVTSTVLVEAATARVGHGAHCDIRLPIDQAAYEHLDVTAENGEIFVVALVDTPPTLVAGVPLRGRARILPDDTIEVSGTRFGVQAIGPAITDEGSKKSGPSPIVVGAGALTAVFMGLILLRPAAPPIGPAPHEPPNIFVEVSAQCPHAAPDQAAAFAEERFTVAEARRERYPFVPRDGVVAAALYELAAACFRTAGDPASAASATQTAAALRETITIDFRSRVLRLEYSLRSKDNELALEDIVVLRQLVDGKRSTYLDWLLTSQREVQAQVAKEKKK